MKIGIIGGGVVGQAVKYGFAKKCEVFISDLNNNLTIEELCKKKLDIVFVCVNAPTTDLIFDDTNLVNVLEKLNNNFTGSVCIKSTTPPDVLIKFDNKYKNLKIVHTPEFLTDRNANEDFINPAIIVIGSNNKLAADYVKTIYTSFSSIKRECLKNLHIVDLVTASLLKYGFNSFYVTKIMFMNELYNVLQNSDTNITWDKFKEIYGSNLNIGNSYLDVPGHDGHFGFGGKCFTKDAEAFLTYAKSIKTPLKLLDTVLKVNDKIRDK